MAVTILQAPFVGRSAELGEIARLLERSRLVTLMGTGGAGKTRLAMEAAQRLRGRFPGGAFLCELASAKTGNVRAALVAAIGLPPEAPDAAVRDRLTGPPVLILVDNCEHIREAAAAVIGWILELAPSLSVLATSRERLRLTVEIAWMLPSMTAAESLELLVTRAAARAPEFAVEAANRRALEEICRRLDGLPLAIELAAARLALLAPEQMARLLDESLSLLTGGEGVLRHRTMRAALEWSVDLLDQGARQDLWRLSVFPAGFSLAGAQAVLEAGPAPTLDRLGVLRDASLVVSETVDGESRYRLLEPVRQFAAERLAESGSANEVPRRHAAHVVEVSEFIDKNLFGVRRQREALAAFSLHLPDIRQAVDWSLVNEPAWAARIMGRTGFAWEITARVDEAAALLRRSEPLAESATDRARLLNRLGSIVSRARFAVVSSGVEAERQMIWREAVEAGRQGDDPRELGFALSFCASAISPDPRCLDLLDEAFAIAVREGDGILEAWNRFLRANALFALGRVAEARESMEAALAIVLDLDDEWGVTQSTANLIGLCISLGDYAGARRHLRRAIATLDKHPEWSMGVAILDYTAQVAERSGRPVDALRLVGALKRLRRETGVGSHDAVEVAEAARAQVPSAAAAAAALAAGERFGAREAFALARQIVEARPERPDDRLTKRELEVALLVAGGLSNKEMASRLHISVRTVEGHVEKVLGKLDLRSRVQIATWAAEHELLD